jgi:hypothetical protein
MNEQPYEGLRLAIAKQIDDHLLLAQDACKALDDCPLREFDRNRQLLSKQLAAAFNLLRNVTQGAR